MDTQLNAFYDHTCFICDKPIEVEENKVEELKKASTFSVDADLGLEAHDACLEKLSTDVEASNKGVDDDTELKNTVRKAIVEVLAPFTDAGGDINIAVPNIPTMKAGEWLHKGSEVPFKVVR